MKTLRDSLFVEAEEGIEEIQNVERGVESSVAGLFLRTRVMIAKAFARAEVCLVGGSSCVYACAGCHSIIHRKMPDMPKDSVLCVSCKSEVFLSQLKKCEYPYGYAQGQ